MFEIVCTSFREEELASLATSQNKCIPAMKGSLCLAT
ncbi:MAG: hypothetical protein JWP75_322 [Frondihabitans sp.]|nr:hypothetical protein [Frondihabitans sp.]